MNFQRVASAINCLPPLHRTAVTAAFRAEFPEYSWTTNAKGHVVVEDPQGTGREAHRAPMRVWP